jgi:hypothetical protein
LGLEKFHRISLETNRKIKNQEKTTEKLKINGDGTVHVSTKKIG